MSKSLSLRWDKFQIFYQVAYVGSFLHTAKFLNITQPVITKKIQSLEKEFEIKLLMRHKGSKGVNLTAEGLKIFQILHRIDRDFSKIDKYLLELKDKEE